MDERRKALLDRLSTIFPLLIAVFAAVLSINDLQLSKYAVKMDTLFSARDRNFHWYQAKGIKSGQVESQLRFFNALVKSGIVDEAKAQNIQSLAGDLGKEVERYEKDRKEILLGSEAVGKENWSQEINGVFGQLPGLNVLQSQIDTYKPIRTLFLNSSMLLRICLALGAVGVMIAQASNRIVFFILTLLSGIAGTIYCVLGFIAMMPM